MDLFAPCSWLSSFGGSDNSFHRFVFTPHQAWHAAILFYSFHAGSALWCGLSSVCWSQLWEWAVCMHAQSLSHVLLFCNPENCSPPGSSLRGIIQERILEWVVTSSCSGSSQPRDWTCISCIGRQIPYHWATWESLTRSWGHLKSLQKGTPHILFLSKNWGRVIT